MKNSKWSVHTIVRYALLQTPVIAVLVLLLILSRKNEALPSKAILILLIIWLAKDIVLYPFVWRAYDPERQKRKNPLIGLKGIVQQRLDPTGYVQIRGELWRAEIIGNEKSIEKGKSVNVKKVSGLILLVESERLPDVG